MHMTVGLVAREVKAGHENTFDVLGICDALAYSSFPATLPPLQLFLRFEAAPSEGGPHPFMLELLAPTGGRLTGSGSTALQLMASIPGGNVYGTIAPVLPRVGVAGPGRYVFRVFVGGSSMGDVPLDLLTARKAATSGPVPRAPAWRAALGRWLIRIGERILRP